jgi:hypothetical protein
MCLGIYSATRTIYINVYFKIQSRYAVTMSQSYDFWIINKIYICADSGFNSISQGLHFADLNGQSSPVIKFQRGSDLWKNAKL